MTDKASNLTPDTPDTLYTSKTVSARHDSGLARSTETYLTIGVIPKYVLQ